MVKDPLFKRSFSISDAVRPLLYPLFQSKIGPCYSPMGPRPAITRLCLNWQALALTGQRIPSVIQNQKPEAAALRAALQPCRCPSMTTQPLRFHRSDNAVNITQVRYEVP